MRVLQLIDSLDAGGAERMAVNLANALTNRVEGSYLCSTRAEGLLKASVQPTVSYLFLKKRSTLDLVALYRFYKFIRAERIGIIHAHSSSFFLGTLTKLMCPRVQLLWHDHYGNSAFLERRPKRILKWCSKYFAHIFCVNRDLEQWVNQHLDCKSVSYLPNFVVPKLAEPIVTALQGTAGKRMLCLANLRAQKDHITLLNAFRLFLDANNAYNDWTLHCVGQDFNDGYSKAVHATIEALDLGAHVFIYGSKPDITAIISQCEIGVLASKSEGLPLALLEYGLGGLGVIATDVGNCKLVIPSLEEGTLVRPHDAEALANALSYYVKYPEERERAALRLKIHVLDHFSEAVVIDQVLVYYQAMDN